MKTVISVIFFIFFYFVEKSQEYCLSPSQTPEAPINIASASEIISNSSILKDLLTRAKDESGRRKYQFNYLFFKMMNCKGTFDEDAGNILREICDFCFFSGPSNKKFRSCKSNCFTTESFDECLKFYGQQKNVEINIFEPLVQKLNESYIAGSGQLIEKK